jgi:chemotaxis protein CheX
MSAVEPVPTEADLREIADQVWASYLDPEGVNPLLPADPDKARIDIMAAVSITGSWHGHVVFACTQKAARQAAAGFLAMDTSEVADEDVTDVLGELANIVGGNVKSMLPAGCFVSLPHVVSDPTASHWPGVVQIANLTGEWGGESVTISMWQEAGESGQSGGE